MAYPVMMYGRDGQSVNDVPDGVPLGYKAPSRRGYSLAGRTNCPPENTNRPDSGVAAWLSVASQTEPS
jgi:hypothetical protein